VIRAAARLSTAVVLSLLAALIGPGVAWAHAGGLTSSSNEPVVLMLSPAVPGLTVTVVESGARLRLDNRTGTPVAVIPPPGTVLDTLPTVERGGAALWADPRVAAAAGLPRPAESRSAWVIPLRVGDEPVSVLGEQRWPPPPDAVMWWLMCALAMVLPAGLVAMAGMRGVPGRPTRCAETPDSRGARRARGARAVRGSCAVRGARGVLAVGTAVVMVAHVVHLWGSALVVAEGSVVVVFLAAAGFAVLGWPLGLVGAWFTARGRPAGPLLCCVAGALIAVVIAPADVFSFHDAVIPFAWSPDLDRLLVVLTVGGGLGVVGAAWLIMRRSAPGPRTPVVDVEHRGVVSGE
jgi:hypothetical protein